MIFWRWRFSPWSDAGLGLFNEFREGFAPGACTKYYERGQIRYFRGEVAFACRWEERAFGDDVDGSLEARITIKEHEHLTDGTAGVLGHQPRRRQGPECTSPSTRLALLPHVKIAAVGISHT